MLRRAARVNAALLCASAALCLRYKLGLPPLPPASADADPPEENSTEADEEKHKRERAMFEERSSWRYPWIHMPHTPVLTCEPGYSVLMDRFDWQVVPTSGYGEGGGLKNNSKHPLKVACAGVEGRPFRNDTVTAADPRTVWVVADGLQRLLELAEERLDPGRNDRVVLFSGTEVPLSRAFGSSDSERAATVARLRRYFGKIFFQVKDIELEHVTASPMGFCWGYNLMPIGNWFRISRARGHRWMSHKFLDLEDLFRANLSGKTRGILATGGLIATWLETEKIKQHINWFQVQLALPGYPPSNSSFQAVRLAAESRQRMRLWANSSKGQAAGVELRRIDATDWWFELYKYRFLCSPIGSAIQTSKTIEALMVLTIPIIQRAGFALHDEIAKMGFPIVLIDGWWEVTAATADAWWRALSPRLESFRRNCLTVDGFWRLLIGEVDHCG